MRFHNAVLTGACGGFGQALARRLIAGGARVGLVGLDRAVLDELAALAPSRCAVFTPDVSDAEAMAAVGAHWMERFGAPDLVIANAGVAGGFDTARPDDLRVMRRMLEINLLGVACTFSPFLGAMQDAGRPAALVGVASIAGWRGMPAYMHYDANWLFIVDNLSDFAHLAFVHTKTLGGSEEYAYKTKPVAIERLPDGAGVLLVVIREVEPP